jgi:hypothetical protein
MSGRTAIFLFLLIAVGCLAGNAEMVMITTDPPGGAVTGSPGQTVGYGFTITNTTPYYLLFDNSYFCEPSQDPEFTTCTQSLGTYQDYIANNFTEVAPMSSLSESFNANTMTGFGAYDISPTAMVGATDSGNLVATYMEYQGDPFNGGTQASLDIELSAPASVTVIPVSATPEPSSAILAALGALGALLYKARFRKTTDEDNPTVLFRMSAKR